MGWYLDVSVNDVLAMEVPDSLQSLYQEFKGLGLAEDIFGVLVGEEVALLGILHNHIDGVSFEDSVPQFDDVRVVEGGVQPYLSLYEFDLGLGGHVAEVDLGGMRITTLRAYILQVERCLASLTVPKEPQPTFWLSMIWNSRMLENFCRDGILSILFLNMPQGIN